MEVYYRVVDVRDRFVTFETHHLFVDSQETADSPSTLRFMLKEEVAEHLAEAGFTDVAWFGDLERRSVRTGEPRDHCGGW